MKKKIAVFFGLVIMLTMAFALPVVAEEGTWERKADMPYATWRNTSCVFDEKIYVFSYEWGSNFQIYDPVSDSWTARTNISLASGPYCSGVIDGKIYICSMGSGYIEEYDPLNDTWVRKSQITSARDGVGTAVLNNKIYIVGGLSNILYIYDPISDTWDNIPSEMNLKEVAVAAFNGKLYMFGGSTINGVVGSQKTVIEYDPATNIWTTKSDLPEALHGCTATVANGKIYVAGGITAGGAPVDTFYEYDPVGDTWLAKENMLVVGGFAGSQTLNGVIYIFGGGYSATNVVQAYTLSDAPSIDGNLYVLLDVAEQAQLSVTHNLADNANLTWTSTNNSVAVVDANGVVTAIAEGTCFIYARNSDGSYEDYIPVKVVAGGADEFRLALHLNAGESKRLWITDDYASVSWTSMDPATATVDSTGRVTGVARGLCLVQGEYGGNTYTIYVRVNG